MAGGPRRDYATQAAKFARVCEIAAEIVKAHPPPDIAPEHRESAIAHYETLRTSALDPDPPFRTLRSLKYLEEAALTYWNEAAPSRAVDLFWARVTAERLGYERVDRLAKVLARGRIVGRHEYELVTDMLVVGQQEGRIDEAMALSAMLGAYEARRR